MSLAACWVVVVAPNSTTFSASPVYTYVHWNALLVTYRPVQYVSEINSICIVGFSFGSGSSDRVRITFALTLMHATIQLYCTKIKSFFYLGKLHSLPMIMMRVKYLPFYIVKMSKGLIRTHLIYIMKIKECDF